MAAEDADISRRREVLLVDYAETRDDERTFVSSQGVAITLLVTILVGLIAVLADPSPEGVLQYVVESKWLLAGLPAVPLAILLFLQLQGTVAILRSYYLRSLETELTALDPAAAQRPTLAGSYVTTMLEISSLRRGRGAYRILAMSVIALVIVVFGGLLLFIVKEVDWPQQVAMAVGYGPLIALLVREFRQATLGGRDLWDTVMAGRPHVEVRRRGRERQVRTSRSIVSYVLLPRVEELVKLSFLTVGALCAALFAGATGAHVWAAWGLALLVFEYLVYEARYQWNDVRGAASDAGHLYATNRARLPTVGGSLQRGIRVSSLAALGRMITATTICVVLISTDNPFRATGIVLAAASVAALITAAGYEALRASDEHPRAVWTAVGIGYGIRMALGGLVIASVSPGDLTSWIWIPLVLAALGWAIGSTSILMAWALEASASVWVHPDCISASTKPRASAAADDLRPRDTLTAGAGYVLHVPEAAGRSHIEALASTLDVGLDSEPDAGRPGAGWVRLDAFPVLSRSSGLHWWNRTAVLAAGLSAGLGFFVAVSWAAPGAGGGAREGAFAALAVGVAVLGALVGAWAVTQDRAAARWAFWGAGTVALGLGTAAVLWASRPDAAVGRSVLTGLIGAGLVVFFHYANYTIFRDSSYRRLKNPFQPVVEVVSNVWLGSATTSRLRAEASGTPSHTGGT